MVKRLGFKPKVYYLLIMEIQRSKLTLNSNFGIIIVITYSGCEMIASPIIA